MNTLRNAIDFEWTYLKWIMVPFYCYCAVWMCTQRYAQWQVCRMSTSEFHVPCGKNSNSIGLYVRSSFFVTRPKKKKKNHNPKKMSTRLQFEEKKTFIFVFKHSIICVYDIKPNIPFFKNVFIWGVELEHQFGEIINCAIKKY